MLFSENEIIQVVKHMCDRNITEKEAKIIYEIFEHTIKISPVIDDYLDEAINEFFLKENLK